MSMSKTLHPLLSTVQPKKTRPGIMGKIVVWDVKNQIKTRYDYNLVIIRSPKPAAWSMLLNLSCHKYGLG